MLKLPEMTEVQIRWVWFALGAAFGACVVMIGGQGGCA